MQMTPEYANKYARKILVTKRKNYINPDNLCFHNNIHFYPKLKTFYINNQKYKMDKQTYVLLRMRYELAETKDFLVCEEFRIIILYFVAMFATIAIVTSIECAIDKRKQKDKQEVVKDTIQKSTLFRHTINGKSH